MRARLTASKPEKQTCAARSGGKGAPQTTRAATMMATAEPAKRWATKFGSRSSCGARDGKEGKAVYPAGMSGPESQRRKTARPIPASNTRNGTSNGSWISPKKFDGVGEIGVLASANMIGITAKFATYIETHTTQKSRKTKNKL